MSVSVNTFTGYRVSLDSHMLKTAGSAALRRTNKKIRLRMNPSQARLVGVANARGQRFQSTREIRSKDDGTTGFSKVGCVGISLPRSFLYFAPGSPIVSERTAKGLPAKVLALYA